MLNTLSDKIIWGSETFGYGKGTASNPAIFLFGFPIYLYALIIVFGMLLAILIAAKLFKKRGIDPYDACIYAIAIIPFGVLGARLYFFIFPYSGQPSDWSQFFAFRNGGLGIYGGVIFGTIAAFVTAKIKKQNYGLVQDCIIPGLFLAQSIGRWGNFVNQEAFGNLVTDARLQFFPYAVYIDARGAWYQATFFYESFATLIGFIVCMLLIRSKRYKIGWCSALYGIYYGVVRLLIESLRSDSLYLWIGTTQTDIKISQLVSVFAILFGLWNLSKIYRKQIHALYSKLFKSEREEVAHSRWILAALCVLLVAFSVLMYLVSAGIFNAAHTKSQSAFIAGFLADVVAVYAFLGIFALQDRLRLYCAKCGARNEPAKAFITDNERDFIWFLFYVVLSAALLIFGTVFVVRGFAKDIVNSVVLGFAALVCAIAAAVVAVLLKRKVALSDVHLSAEKQTVVCACGETYEVRLNKFLLTLFPYKVYPDYGVENLREWIDPEKSKKQTEEKQ